MTPTFIVDDAALPTWLAPRTLRALAPTERAAASIVSAAMLPEALRAARAPVFVLVAGAYGATLTPPRPSATGRSLLALGATRGDPKWTRLLGETGGDLTTSIAPAELPTIAALYTESPDALAAALAAQTRWWQADLAAAWSLVTGKTARAVRIATLDVDHSRSLRVLQVVASLHRGGAERVALDLATELGRHDIEARLAVLDAPRRAAYEAPTDIVRLSDAAPDRAGRVAAAAAVVARDGYDVVHAHLLSREELVRLGASGASVVTTLHNARVGLPPGVEALGDAARLAIACSRGVADDVAAIGTPVRVAWNGVAPAAPAASTAPAAPVASATPAADARARVRSALGLADGALVLLAIANPRAQKRLDVSVHVLAELRALGHDAHLVIAGAPLVTSDDARRAEVELAGAIDASGLHARVHRLGSRDDVPDLCAAADVVLSTSAWEGLSLAHLEAIAARRPLVATATHGTDELARKHDGVVLVPVGAPPAVIAAAVLTVRAGPAPSGLVAAFSRDAMVSRTAMLLRRVAPPLRAPDGPIALITNNLSVGGAQTSARRLLTEMHAHGERVFAVVVEEQPEHPTPGRRSLVAAGIEVLATPSLRLPADDPRLPSTDGVVAHVLAALDARRPAAVLFWNLVAEVRVRVADALVGTPCFDVSPGEMSYASLDRYLAHPRAGHPVLDERDYGRLLAGVVAKYEGERGRAARLGAPVTVIPNGVIVPAAAPAPPPPSPVVRLGTLARIAPHKKLEELVAALEALSPDVRGQVSLAIGGPIERGADAYAASLVERARALPIEFVGEVDAAAFLGALDVFVMVSAPAGCPNASLEAMAAGRPVIATDVGGAREQLTPDVGRLVPAADADAFAAAITELASDRALRERLGRAGHARARAHFSVARMAADYRALCRGHGGRRGHGG